MKKILMATAGLALLSVMPLAGAHHGFAAHFDPNQIIRIEGTVKQFDFINPHAFLYIDSVNEVGEPVVYLCDLQARTQLVRRGVDQTLFTVGEPIIVEGFPARRDPYGCEFGTGYFADGSSYTMRSTDQARTQFAENLEIPLVPGVSRSIFGNWIRPGMFGDASGRGTTTGQDSITPAGETARNQFDPIADNPVVRCEGGSPVRNWGSPGLATSIRQVDDKIFIYHETMDVNRTIHMNLSEHPANMEPTDMGYSIGYFEGNMLVISTAGFMPGVLTGSTLHTDQMTMEERVSVQEETGRLLISWVVNEPVYYSEPITGSQQLQSTSQPIIQYECSPEVPEDYQ
ncbi:MAG: DUF6152 family protein [Pseudomonadota bacterium]|nr:DUF6152 family protein [Pseudomonadota bacterium]